MYFTGFLLVATSLIGHSSAACFMTGVGWSGSQESAKGAVRYWCNKTTADGLSGKYHSGDRRSRCSNLLVNGATIEKKVDFVVEWLGSTAKMLSQEDCINKLNAEIGCNLGGSKESDGWQFTSDPNNGLCGK